MIARLLTVSIASLTLVSAAALAQTGTTASPGGTSSGTTTMGSGSGSSGGTMSSGTMSGHSMGTNGASGMSGSTSGMSGSTMGGSNMSGSNMGGQMAQQPAGNFNPSMYRSQTDCLNAAQLAHAPLDSCKSVRTRSRTR